MGNRTFNILPPFVTAAAFLMNFYSSNLGKMQASELFRIIILLGLLTVSILFLTKKFLKSIAKASLATSAFLALILSYGRVCTALDSTCLNYFTPGFPILFTLWVSLMFLVLLVLKTIKGDVDVATKLLLLFLIPSLVLPLFSTLKFGLTSEGHVSVLSENSIKRVANSPDIYYLIFDRYARADVLEKKYDFDNKPFQAELESRKFFVADASNANYLKTAHSLASSLNMEYLIDLDQPKESRSWKPIYDKVSNFKVQKILKNLGYKFVFFGSWWQPTNINSNADENINIQELNEAESVFFKQSFFYPLVHALGLFDENKSQWDRINYQLESLAGVPDMDESTFVFAHFLVPHEPYVFLKDGSYQKANASGISEKEKYIGQVEFVNRKILETVDILLAKNPNTIIVLQSDEGPHPERYAKNPYGFKWLTADNEELQQKFGILNAVYLPKKDYEKFYPGASPINTFRIIFSNYFDLNYPLLPDKSYIYNDYYHPYDLYEITDKLN